MSDNRSLCWECFPSAPVPKQGPTGPKGATGTGTTVTGPKGPTGQSITGPTGPTGEGEQGPTGTSVVVTFDRDTAMLGATAAGTVKSYTHAFGVVRAYKNGVEQDISTTSLVLDKVNCSATQSDNEDFGRKVQITNVTANSGYINATVEISDKTYTTKLMFYKVYDGDIGDTGPTGPTGDYPTTDYGEMYFNGIVCGGTNASETITLAGDCAISGFTSFTEGTCRNISMVDDNTNGDGLTIQKDGSYSVGYDAEFWFDAVPDAVFTHVGLTVNNEIVDKTKCLDTKGTTSDIWIQRHKYVNLDLLADDVVRLVFFTDDETGYDVEIMTANVTIEERP